MTHISIITICFNNLTELIKTVHTVNIQTKEPFQHIIIDGSSNNDIKNWLESNIQPTYRAWHCQKDKGIYDAFNIGLHYVRGNIVQFLNSGDIFYNEQSLEFVYNFFEKNPAIHWSSANMMVNKFNANLIMGEPFDKKLLYRGMRKINHQTCFVKKILFDKYGGFNNYKIGMDYDFIVRIANENYGYLNEVIIEFDSTGISNNQYIKSLQDNILIYEKYHGLSLKCRLWQFRNKMLYYLFKYHFFKQFFIKKFSPNKTKK